MAEEVLNPLTGLPVGGSADVTEIDPKTDVKVPMNPLTGQAVGSIQTPQRSYIGGSRRQAASLSDQMLNSQHSVKLGEDIRNFTKYGVPLGQDLDWQEIRARNQSTAEQWGNGLAKAGVTALGAVAENTLGVVFGLGELATGGSYYDNAIGKSVDSTNEWMRENMPNYLTQEEQKMSTLSKLGTANFWADTVANGLGYSIGSIATMWMTGGGGLITKGITGAAKGLGVYNAAKAVINGTKLAAKLGKGANFGTRLMRASQMLEAGAMMSLAEASVEARETQKTLYNDLVQDHINKNNLSSISEIDAATLQEFEDVSYAAGNTNFTAQLPVLMGTNLLMFGKQVAGFKGASKASSDVAFDQVKRKAVSKLADKSVWRQTLDRMRPTAINALEEAGQEGFQFASGVFAHSYHTDKYADGGYGDMAKSLNKALSETFGTQEGLESMFVGALTGGLMGSAQSTMGKEYSTRKSSAAALAKFINGGYLNNAEQKMLNASASASVMQQMQVHLEKGDIKKFKDAQFKLIQYQAYEALQRGGMDVYLEKLEDAKNLDNAQFMEAFGYQTQDAAGNALTLEDQTGGKSQAEVIDSIKKKVKNFRKVYDNVNTQFPLADKTSGLPRMLMSEENRKAEDATYEDQENLRAQLIFSGAEIGNRSNRMTDIQKNMGDTISNSISPKKAKLKADLDALLADQDPNSVGEIDPAKDFDAGDQYQKIEDGLQEIRDELIKEDGDVNASNKFFKDAIDYVTLAQENKRALDSYNKLSSDEYFQEQFKREVEEAQKVAKQAQADKKGREVLESAKSAQELGENMPEGISSEIRQEYDKKYKEFKDAENEAIKKFLENDLDTLYNMDKEKMSPIEIQALKDAIDILEKDRENALAPKVKFGFESESTASITEDGVSIMPNAEYQQKQQELEEAFRPENLGDVQAMDVNGRVFQIDGNLHYNVQPDPLDAIIRDKNGNIVGVKLRDESGNFVTYSGPETRVDAIAYGILMAEQLKSESYQELSKDEIFEKLTAFNEEVAQELSTKGDRGKHGSKTTELLREEVYSLERARDEALETYDQLRTYYMQELDATKTELENDKELKDLNRKINSIRAQIGARNRILKLRGETTTPTDSEILKVERKAMKKIENFEQDLASAQNEIQEAQQEIESLQEDVDRFKAADDIDSYRAALADRRAAEALLAEAEKNVKNLKRKINYHKNKLKRLANEKSKQPAGDAEQAAPGTAEKAQEQVDEREDTDSGAVSKETQTNVKPVRYKIKDKTATYTVKYENNEYVVYNSKGNPVTWKEGQQKHKNRIVGKHLVQEGKAVVVEYNGKKFIVTPKYLSPSETPFIIQEDGKIISRAGLATQQLADIFDAIMRKAAAKFRAMVADTTEAPTDETTEKNAIEEKSKQNLKKEVDNKQTQPGTPKSDKLTVVAEYEMSDLIDDDTAPSGPVGNIADLAPPGAEPKRGEPSARDEEDLGIISEEEFENTHRFPISTVEGEQQAVDFMIEDVKGATEYKLGNRSNVGGRDVIEVEVLSPKKRTFLMYRSTGTGSSAKSKGLWVPIPGFAKDGHFIKVYDSNGKDPKFSKYNVPLFQSIANTLESLEEYEGVDPMTLEKGWGSKSNTSMVSKPINIYAGTNENTELSNFAERPVMYGNTQFNTVEGAFQAIKANDYADKDSKKNQDILDKLATATGAEAKRLGRQIEGLNTSVWDKDSPAIMKDLIKKSFEANPSARKALLATGNAPLTHTQDKSRWGKLFPKLLMEVRDELRQANVKPAAPTMSGSGTQLTAVAAREDKVEVVDELNYKGDVQIKSRVTVSDTGAPDTFDADTLNEEPILVNKEKLADPNLIGKDVTFEIIENDYYKSNPKVAVPIYYKIDGEIVGKLEANTPNRDVLEQRLRSGEQVTMQVSEVIAGNFNHSRTADGNSFFSDPREQFGNPILAFVEVVDKIPNWTIGNASSDKNITTQIQSDIVGTGTEKINYGQVGIIVRPENNPGGQARISMASTADLSAKAQNVAYEALVNEGFDTAKEIVANSLFEANLGGAAQTQYMQFGTFKQGSNFVVFQSPALGKFVRITEENLRDAHKGKPFKYNIVEVSADDATGTLFFKNTGEVVEGYEAAEDMKEFLKLKKYHVSRDLGNLSNPYTSKITGDTYDTYQEYLFSPKEIGTDRTIGKGHHSILTTDVVMMNGSMFHNPKITFKESAGKIKSAKDIIQSDKTAPGSVDNISQEQKANLLDELSDMGGLNFGDQIKKDELDQDCPF